MDSGYHIFILATCILLIVHSLIKNKATKKKLPPGPSLLPFLAGSIFSCTELQKLATQPHKALTELATVHGPLMTLKLGSVTSIVVSSSVLAKNLLLRSDPDHFSTPFVLDAVYAHQHHQYSVAWLPSASPQWRALRRFYATQVVSARRLDASGALRHSKVVDLVALLRGCARDGVAVDVGHVVLMTFFEIMLSANFSRDGRLVGRKKEEIKETMLEIIKETGKMNIVDLFPMLHSVDPQGIRHRLTALSKKLFGVFDEIIDSRLKMRKEGVRSSSPNGDEDVLDLLLDVLESQKDGLDDRNFTLHTLLDLFGAGMDTTSKTVEWGIAELLNNPDVLKKAQEELDMTIGKGKLVEESDISKLPYFQAVLKETFRLHPPVPLLLPRMMEEDVQVSGYTFPKGARMLVNVWAISRDPEKWVNPNLFSPERFLGTNIDLKGQHFDLIPFGAGRRICPGMPLALRAVPMIMASLINCFDWKLEDGGGHAEELINMQDAILITLKKVKPVCAIPICRA